MPLSERAVTVQASPIRRLAPFMLQARERGVKIHHLNIGQPDIETPKVYMDAIRGFAEKVLAYGPSDGLPELKKAISGYFGRYDIAITPADVQITLGGSEAIQCAFCIVGDPGDEVIIPEPFYTNYNGFAAMVGLKVVPVTTRAEDGFAMPPIEAFEKAITPRTRAILACSPNNPTGVIFTPEELDELALLAQKHDLFLIGDEVYREFVYEGNRPKSLLELKGVEDRVIVVDSISKRFSACGARVGALISRNQELMACALKFAQARLCPPTIEQLGAIAAYKMSPDYFEPVREEYRRRRDTLYEGLCHHPGVLLKKPMGAFYMIARFPIDDANDFAQWMLTDFQVDGETVMVAPADGFYATPGLGKNEVRLAYVLEVPKLQRSARILVEGIEAFNRTARK